MVGLSGLRHGQAARHNLVTAACALVAVGLPVYLLLFSGRMAGGGPAAALELHDNPWFVARGWITVVYFIASLAAVVAFARRLALYRPGLAITGAAFFLVASAIDSVFRGLQLMVVYGEWGRLLATTQDPALKDAIAHQTQLFEVAGVGWRVAFLSAFAAARLCLAAAAWRTDALSRAVAVTWAAAGLLNLQSLLLAGGVEVPLPAGRWYLPVWGVSFLLLAVWLRVGPRERPVAQTA